MERAQTKEGILCSIWGARAARITGIWLHVVRADVEACMMLLDAIDPTLLDGTRIVADNVLPHDPTDVDAEVR
eukprot:7378909-Prymnesium_polylepis.1